MNSYRYVRALFKYLTNINYHFLINAGLHLYDKMPDEEFIKRKFKATMEKELDLQNPQTFNEKLQWIKLYDRKPEYTMMVDKYRVREYIKELLGEEYLIPLLGVWDNPDDIDFDALPDQFVLKCNHNSGLGMCICKDKSKLDIKKVREELKKGLAQDYYLTGREWPYKNVLRKIICEQYMEDQETQELRDYKFYCIHGEVKCVMINTDRQADSATKADYYDKKYNWLNFTWGYEHADIPPEKPLNFEKMIELAEILATDLLEARIDFYECNGKIYFGEITFFDGSGFDRIDPIEWDYKLGSYLTLPSNIKAN